MCASRQRPDLDSDMLFRRAMIHAIQEIGEAAARISENGRALLPELPWGQIVRTRHIMVHEYFGIDLDTVWRIAREHVPTLPALMDRAIAQLPLPPDIEPLK